MAVDLIMPKLGLTMEEGMVARWLVAEGDLVEKGQIVLEVETDKAVVEVEATASGVMGPLLINDGQTVPVTMLLARIYAPGEKVPQRERGEHKAEAGEQPVLLFGNRTTPLARRVAEKEKVDLSSIPAHRVFSSPRARKRARELGIDWRTLPGSGPRRRVVEKDVLRAAQAARPGPTPSLTGVESEVTWETPTTVQRITAERMVASFGSAPHFCLTAQVRADALLDVRSRLLPLVAERVGVRLTITDLMMRILGVALAEYPRANAFWGEGRIGLYRQINVGVAVATEAGLVVPVLHQANYKSLSQIASERTSLVEKARAGKLSVDDLSGSTFTLTNLGMFRVDTFQAILNPPQSAILAMGRIAERPVVVDGQLLACPTVVLSLSCDHRVLDGALAARFLGRVAELIEKPFGLLA